jgi:hypothetical protein
MDKNKFTNKSINILFDLWYQTGLYSLDPQNINNRGKAEAYRRALGYTKENAASLVAQVHSFVTSGNNPFSVSQAEYGTKYRFRVPVTGPNGKTKPVIPVYQIDNGDTIPRLITNYVEGRELYVRRIHTCKNTG